MKKLIYAVLLTAAITNVTGCGSKQEEGSSTAMTVESTQETTKMTEAQTTEKDTGNKEDRVKLSEVYEAVKTVYGDAYIPSMEYDEQTFADLFGISNAQYDSYIAEGPMISANVDTFVAVQAKKGKGEEVEKILQTYRESLIRDTMQYPVNLPKINASQIIRHGDDVYFVMLGTPSAQAEELGEEEALKSAQQNNQKGIDAINRFYGI